MLQSVAALPRQVVHPSVTFKYRDHIGWNTSKIISRLISLGFLLSADPNITDLLQEDYPKIPGGIGVGGTVLLLVQYIVSHSHLFLCSECK